MVNFYILESFVEKSDIFVDQYNATDEVEYEYSKGKTIAKIVKPIRLFYKYKMKRMPDYLTGIHLFPVVSRRFKELLEKERIDNLEFHPVDLICKKTNEVDRSYSFLNILKNVECFDRENSVFETPEYDDKLIAEVYNLAIDENLISGRDLVRMAEIPSVILISKRLKTAIEKARLKGIEFNNIESFEKI